MEKIKVRKTVFSEIEVARLLAEQAAKLDNEAVDEMQPVTVLYDEDSDDITVEYTAFETDYNKPEPVSVHEWVEKNRHSSLYMQRFGRALRKPDMDNRQIQREWDEALGLLYDIKIGELKPKVKVDQDGNESKCKTCMFKFACPDSTER